MNDEDDDLPDEAGGGSFSGNAISAGRFDKVLAEVFPRLSRTRLKNLIMEGSALLDGMTCRDPSAAVTAGQALGVDVPAPVKSYPEPESIPLDVVYEDDHLLVINKQAGLVVHPGAGNPSGTLVNALLHHCGETLSGIGGVLRPGIVHRLDKDTTGLMVVAKSDAAHRGLAEQLSDRSLSREYRAVVWKIPVPPAGRIDRPLARSGADRQKMAVVRKGGRQAATQYRIVERYGDAACLLNCRLETGRTHQVRVHAASIGHPLIGDPLYGLQATAQRALLKKTGLNEVSRESILAFPRQALHAWRIGFIHPVNEEDMAFEAPIPKDISQLIYHLKSNN